jgi:recombination protein RecT
MNAPTVAKAASPIVALRQEIDASPEFARVLPAHLSAERFKRVLATAIMENPKLATCERRSVFNAALKCAQDGLLPDGREAVLVIYNDKERGPIAQYQKMIAGVYKLLRNSGELDGIQSHVVYERDSFDYQLGDDPRITHKPAQGLRGKPIGVYAIAKLKDGYTDREFMSVEQVERVRAKSKRPNSLGWSEFWDEMARKTVVRRLAKRLPMSTDREYLRDDDDGDDTPDLQIAAPRPERIDYAPASLATSFDSDELDQGELARSPDNPAAQLSPPSATQVEQPEADAPIGNAALNKDEPHDPATGEVLDDAPSPTETARARIFAEIVDMEKRSAPDAEYVTWWKTNVVHIKALGDPHEAEIRKAFTAGRERARKAAPEPASAVGAG